MATGDVLIAREGDAALPRVPGCINLDVEIAAAQTLAAYLKKQTFTVWGGKAELPETTRDREFQLVDVLDDFPGHDQTLNYPSASIIPRQSTAMSIDTSPYACEDTWDEARGTVVWYLGDASGVFQVGFWADSKALRDSFAASIPGIMNPRESMSGVLLRMPELYACAGARFTLTDVTRINLPDRAFTNEWELRALIRWEAPILDVRRANRFMPRAHSAVSDPQG